MSLNKTEVSKQHEMIGNQVLATGNRRTTHPDAQWFGGAGLGLFLHWGISSVRGDGDISWSMIRPRPGAMRQCLERMGAQGPGKIVTPADYWAQAAGFVADRYAPDKWLAAARAAGFTYAVLTTKHHDGFALWPSDYSDFNTRNHLGGRDLVGEYVAACRRHGLKVGLYFSMPDWYYSRRHMSFRYGKGGSFFDRSQPGDDPDLGMRHEAISPPVLTVAEQQAWMAEFVSFCRHQLEELLTRYGRIDLLWFDGCEYHAITKDRIQELQPGIVVNDRMGFGDYATPEGAFPEVRPGGWWELCHVWNEGGWGYRSHEIYKPTGWVTAELARVRAWGGNFLLNMGPDAHGELPPVAYRRLAELAAWMNHSRESVTDVMPGPWPEACNVPVTCRGNDWYLHISWVWDEPIEVKESTRQPRRLTLLRTGESVAWTPTAAGFRFEIPPCQLSALGDVVKLEWA